MKIQIGTGNRPLNGFLNTDAFPENGSVLATADDLPCDSKSVNMIFSNAVFEHLDTLSYPPIFTEWKRVLADDGIVVALGIPDFDAIAHLYVKGLIDLDSIYNYAVGETSYTVNARRYRGQIHKKLFSIDILGRTFASNGFYSLVFNYAYPNEVYKVNLGVVASLHRPTEARELLTIPSLSSFIDMDTIDNHKNWIPE